MDGLVFTKHLVGLRWALAPFGQEATEPTGGQVGVAAEVREAVLGLVDEVISVRAGVPAQHGQ
ncbi:hypothetical protein ACWD6R_40325 [Streptomyces sp. NPDC005151]